MPRTDRTAETMRPIQIRRHYTKNPHGSVLISFGDTVVLCTATVDQGVPPWLRGGGRGWVTAEYAMLPGSASGGRISRDATKKGRALEISRLIGRSLRSVIDLAALGERQVIVDCDVIQADGGTRTAAVTGGYVALHDAMSGLVAQGVLPVSPMAGQCAAVSVGIVEGVPLVDLCYIEDSSAEVDLNLVMKDGGGIIELQGTAEREPFSRGLLDTMLDMGQGAIQELFALQREALARD